MQLIEERFQKIVSQSNALSIEVLFIHDCTEEKIYIEKNSESPREFQETCDYGQDFCFYHKTKRKATDKTLEQHFLKEFKATCKNTSESELKQQKGNLKNHLYSLSPSITYS